MSRSIVLAVTVDAEVHVTTEPCAVVRILDGLSGCLTSGSARPSFVASVG